MSEPLLAGLQDYFTGKIEQHGASAKGVDWNSEERQALCFRQLLRICENPQTAEPAKNFTLLDYGCGYGALAGHLVRNGITVAQYVGYDMTPAMITHARTADYGLAGATFTDDESAVEPADYVIGSGLLALKLGADEKAWEQHVVQLLEKLWSLTKVGLAFNSLTKYSDTDKMRPDLYYADPGALFHLCKTRFSRQVALLHDYGPYEFTMLVRRDA